MGALFDTAAFYVDNPSTTETAYTPANGDSLTNRFFTPPASASIVTFDRQGVTKGIYRVKSPSLYDNVKGIHIAAGAGQATFGIAPTGLQPLQPQDNLIIEGTGEASGYDVVLMTRYYSDFAGSNMQLASYSTIAPNIVNLYEVEVATTSSATPVTWTDTVLTTTEDLLKANTWHAVLGFTTDVSIGGLAIKGADTSNFRFGGPGKTVDSFTPDYFKRISDYMGVPGIPVFNSANIGNTFVSTIDTGSSTASNVTLHVAQLSNWTKI